MPKWSQNGCRNRSKIKKGRKKGMLEMKLKFEAEKNEQKWQNQSTLAHQRVDLSCLRQYTRTGPREVRTRKSRIPSDRLRVPRGIVCYASKYDAI